MGWHGQGQVGRSFSGDRLALECLTPGGVLEREGGAETALLGNVGELVGEE